MKNNNPAIYTLLIFGLLAMAAGITLYFGNTSHLMTDGEMTKGYIVAYKKTGDGRRLPEIEFYHGRDTIRFVSSSTTLLNHKQNRLDVLYSKDNPRRAMIYDKYSVWGVPLSVGLVGLTSVLFALTIIFVSRRKR